MDKRKPNRRGNQAHRPKERQGRGSDPTVSLHRYLQDSGKLAPRLQRLAQAIAASSGAPMAARLSCDECEAMLEFYVDAEMRGEPPNDLFPAVQKHLKTCSRCQVSYQLLADSLGEEPMTDFAIQAASAPTLPFLLPPASDAPWTKRVHPRIGGAPISFGVAIQASHLRQRLSESQPAMLTRGKLTPGKRTLVLSDAFSLGDRKVAAKLWVQRLEDPAFLRIEIQLASSSPLPEPLHVHVTWNGRTQAGLVHDGKYSLDGIPLSALEGERTLRIEFQADDHPAHSIEGPGGDLH